MGYYCSVCKEVLSEGVNQYSIEHFGKPLCMNHQKTAKSETQYHCNECKQTITYGEFNFSTNNFDMPLCRDCQPEIQEKLSAPPQNFRLNQTSKIEFGKSYPKKKQMESFLFARILRVLRDFSLFTVDSAPSNSVA
jgi:hypothetical protein